ncbi:MAG: Calx-beta protein, partial [Verrucomicrobiaceae bacterium]|nr:Calx-beta protein [Verrucomicrobiaceae bacterium]
WYKWTPTFTGTAVVDTNFSFLDSGVVHSTAVAVYTGTTLANLAYVVSDMNSGYAPGGNYANSRLRFVATAGTTYTVWVGDYNNGPGSFSLELFQESQPGGFWLVAPSQHISPNQGPVPVEIRRYYAGGNGANVTVNTVAGTAKATTDFVPITNQTVYFNGGGTGPASYSQIVYVNAVPDPQVLGDRTFSLQLSNATNGATVYQPSSVTFTIGYGHAIAPGFTTGSLRVSENAGSIQIPIQRGDASGEALITVSPQAYGQGWGVNGVDYNFGPTLLDFLPGQTTSSITVPITDNLKPDGDRKIGLLINPSVNGQTVDGYNFMTVTIVDDEAPVPAAGRISATMGDLEGVHGVVDVQITATGALTGKLVMDRATYTFTGKLSAAGAYSVTVGPATASRTLQIQLVDSATGQYTMYLSANDVNISIRGASVAVANYSAASPCPFAGLYTFSDGAPGAPVKHAMGSFSISALGAATVAGKVFDGTAFTGSGGLNQVLAGASLHGHTSVGQTLYTGGGSIALDLDVVAGAVTTDSTLHLVRPASASLPAGAVTALPGFDNDASCIVAAYTPHPAASVALPQWSTGTGSIAFAGAGYTGSPVEDFSVTAANKITITLTALGGNPSPHLTLAFNNAKGTYTGTLTPPGTAKAQPIFGVIIQQGSQSYGPGFFVNPTNLSSGGSVLLGGAVAIE